MNNEHEIRNYDDHELTEEDIVDNNDCKSELKCMND